jgi:hypothetical protein
MVAGALRASALCCALVLAGCGGVDDVELNGKLFDAVGLNQKAEKREPKLAERAPLVMPPDLQRVPEPGTPPEGAAAKNEVASINDPDARAKQSQKELEAQQAAYCKEHYELAKAHGDNNADLAVGPLGPCQASVITAIQKWSKGDSDEATEDDEQ